MRKQAQKFGADCKWESVFDDRPIAPAVPSQNN